jgi:hypothetical protein
VGSRGTGVALGEGQRIAEGVSSICATIQSSSESGVPTSQESLEFDKNWT